MLKLNTLQEFKRYGQIYHDEAKRILTHLPKLPSKFTSNSKGGANQILSAQNQGSRMTSDDMMEDLERYLNKLINLSPLISNLFYMRDFLLNKGAQEVVGSK